MKNKLLLAIAFFWNLLKSFINFKKNKTVEKQNKSTVLNEIKKVAENAKSKDEQVAQKAIDDMRKLISD